MAGEIAVAVAVVAGQVGDQVLLSVPIAGFPPGFRLREGERVALAPGDAGLVARPLVRTHVVPSTEVTAGKRAVVLGGNLAAVQDATLRSDVPASDTAPVGSQVVFEIDVGSHQGPPQAVAIRVPR
jgi:hypothetical protein